MHCAGQLARYCRATFCVACKYLYRHCDGGLLEALQIFVYKMWLIVVPVFVTIMYHTKIVQKTRLHLPLEYSHLCFCRRWLSSYPCAVSTARERRGSQRQETIERELLPPHMRYFPWQLANSDEIDLPATLCLRM